MSFRLVYPPSGRGTGPHTIRTPGYSQTANAKTLYGSNAIVTGPPFSVSMWVYATALTQPAVLWITTDGTDIPLSASHAYRLQLTDGNWQWLIKAGTSSSVIQHSADTVARNRWYHIAVTEDVDGNRKIVVNGQKGNEQTTIRTLVDLDTTVIGAEFFSSTTQNEWQGSIYWPTVWNVALELSEIRQQALGKHPWNVRQNNILSCKPNNTPDIFDKDDLVRSNRNLWTASGTFDSTKPRFPPIGYNRVSTGLTAGLNRYEAVQQIFDFVEQEGFRWRDDDGSESTATFLELQDTDTTQPKSTNVRLRTLVNYEGNPFTQTAGIQYRKVGDAETEWRAVPL